MGQRRLRRYIGQVGGRGEERHKQQGRSADRQQFLLTKEEAVNAIRKKRNWSATGPDRITNYWWKKAYSLHEGVSNAFMNIVQHDHEYPLWFAEGKTSLIPKAGEFSNENQRPIICLNNMYKLSAVKAWRSE